MTEQAAPAPPRPSRRADLLAVVFVVVAVGLAGWALRDQLPDVVDSLGEIGWWRMVLALAATVLGLLATAEVWKHCLAALGSKVGSPAARRIFFPAQAGKYLPGSIWPFLAQMKFAREHGVPGGLALLAGSVFLVVHAVTSVLVGALLLISQPSLVNQFGWAGVCIPLALVLLHPKVVNALARKLAGRSGVEPPVLRWRHLVAPIAWMFPAWLGYGLGGYLLADPFTDSVVVLALVCTGAFALGWIVGLVVFIAPAGVGAREAVLILALTPLTGVAAATTVSLVLRVAHTVADVVLALRYGLARVRRKERPSEVTTG
ncbi:flippase-like domain-containing protein [Actinophytocola gossypii]|uniref:Flippase-like domain-containing protein n=1 Tax=Actinophytocola gossypii TaxID=2812003 RepID=A0ABT2JFE7_9PSEU|nr:flippase-like domain-containing protein [Actinophytocola gossypii]MCT2586588.1 flippase-like domain-containing protein [Actinophytocola gossypii]